jgi:hypothetical protein
MTIAHGYCSQEALKATLGMTQTTHDVDVDAAISAASRAVDGFCGRRFWQDPAVTTRLYTPHGGEGTSLPVDDISTLTGLVIATDENGDGTWSRTSWTVNGYTAQYGFVVEPPNALADGWPVTRLYAVMGWWPHLTNAVKVTARFGWPSIPADVRSACQILATRFYKRKDTPFGLYGSPEVGVVTLPKVDPDVSAILNRYRRVC